MDSAGRGTGLRRVNNHGDVETRKMIEKRCYIVVDFEDRHAGGLFAFHHSRNGQTSIVVAAKIISDPNHQRLH
jgi:hypothetical protein